MCVSIIGVEGNGRVVFLSTRLYGQSLGGGLPFGQCFWGVLAAALRASGRGWRPRRGEASTLGKQHEAGSPLSEANMDSTCAP